MIVFLAIGYIYLAGWLGATILPTWRGWGPGVPDLPSPIERNWTNLFFRWDSAYYYQAAEQGYEPNGTERAFFPLYPLTVRLFSQISQLPLLWSGLLVSTLSFIGTSIALYRWLCDELGETRAVMSVLVSCFFPVAFYLISFYAEALFILLSIIAIYSARRGKFLASGLTIAFAGATRPQAFLLAVPYLIEFWQQRGWANGKRIEFILGLGLAPLGLFLYTYYLASQQPIFSLSPYFDLLRQEWQTYATFPWITLWDGLNASLFGADIRADWFSRVYSTHDLFYALWGALVCVYAVRHLRLSIAMYLVVGVVYFYTVHGPYGYAFDSMPRRIASLVPIYPAIAHWANTLSFRGRAVVLIFSAVMLAVLAAWFASGRWVS